MKNTLVNSAWPFYVDHVENYAFYKEAFSIEECNKIISIGKNNSLEKATTLGKKTKNYRNSNIFWIYPNSETEWIFRKLTDIILDLNSNFFNNPYPFVALLLNRRRFLLFFSLFNF